MKPKSDNIPDRRHTSSKTGYKGKRRTLRMVIVLIILIILALPMSYIFLFRIYENELVRQTQTELIAQGAVVGAILKTQILAIGGPAYGRRIHNPAVVDDGGPFRIIPASLDLSRDEILSPQISYRPSPYDPDPTALVVGSYLEKIIYEAGRTNLSSVSVTDFRGMVIAGSQGHGLSLEGNLEIAAALQGYPTSVLRRRLTGRLPMTIFRVERRSSFRVYVAMPIMNKDRLLGVVYLSRTPRDVLLALGEEGRHIVFSLLMVLALMGVVSVVTSIMIIAPVKRLAREASLVAEGLSEGFSNEKSILDIRELAELRAVLADMAERLNRRSDYLKAFAAGVSHEFKTPLTSIKGAMEILSEHGTTMDETTKKRFEGNIIGDLDRLEKMVARLLLLARAEAMQPLVGEKCQLNSLLNKLQNHYEHLNYSVKIEGAETNMELAVASDVLETVLRNLIDNSRENSASESEISLQNDKKTCLISIVDNGSGINEESAEKLFTPFYTTRKNKGGTGLGLSLTRTLLTPYRGEINFCGNKPGACFSISIPLVETIPF